MRFFAAETPDSVKVLGLYTEADHPRATVIHVHGYGGDFCSNRFVRRFHELCPAAGISFLSLNLRTNGYLTENYSEHAVSYQGSAVADHDACALDLDAIVESLQVPVESIVLQGHSFGTNVVKRYARTHPAIERIVVLSPADSVRLYEEWFRSRDRSDSRVSLHGVNADDAIRWDVFGMAVDGASYPLPISVNSARRLFTSEVFKEWSSGCQPCDRAALIVRGETDPITRLGTTGRTQDLLRFLPRAELANVGGAGHLFENSEDEMCQVVLDWVLGS